MTCRHRRPVAALLCLALSACFSLQSRPEPVAQVAPAEFPHTVRLTLSDGRRVDLTKAARVGDAIQGLDAGYRSASVPVAEVVRWESPRLSPIRTGATILGVAALGALLLVRVQPPVICFGPAVLP